MSKNKLVTKNNNTYEDNSLMKPNIIVKNVAPRSTFEDDTYFYSCSCCPTVFNWCLKDALGLSCATTTWFLFLSLLHNFCRKDENDIFFNSTVCVDEEYD